jgi:hypothetical protein
MKPQRPAICRSTLGLACAAGILGAMCGCVVSNPGEPGRSVDGLTRIQSKRNIDSVYTAPGTSLAGYRRVMLDPVQVAFKKDWQSSHPNVSAGDVERVRAEAAALFRDTFSSELEKGGYATAQAPAPDVLRVAVSIVDLDFVAPSAPSTSGSGSYGLSPSGMTLLAELRDSVSGAILVRAADHERGRQSGNLQIADDMSGSNEAKSAFAMWSGVLRDALDDAKATASK